MTRVDDHGVLLGRDELGPGEHFGEGSLLRTGTRATTAVATAPTTVLSFPAEQFKRITGCFHALRRLLEATSRRFQPARAIIPDWVPTDRLRVPLHTVMSSPVLTMRQDATLEQCLSQFVANRFNCFPIVDKGSRLVALVTSTDLFAALRRDVDLQQPLQTIATTKVHCLGAAEPVERAVEIMRRRDVKHVIVTDHDQRVVGIVSLKDILKLILTASPKPAQNLG